jgi:acetamidase/formamidase
MDRILDRITANHTIHANHQHMAWDNSRPPAITAATGDVVSFEDIDATSGQLAAGSTVDDIRTLDFSLVNPIAGPV